MSRKETNSRTGTIHERHMAHFVVSLIGENSQRKKSNVFEILRRNPEQRHVMSWKRSIGDEGDGMCIIEILKIFPVSSPWFWDISRNTTVQWPCSMRQKTARYCIYEKRFRPFFRSRSWMCKTSQLEVRDIVEYCKIYYPKFWFGPICIPTQWTVLL